MTTPDINLDLIREQTKELPAITAVLKYASENAKSFSKTSVRTFYSKPDAMGRRISNYEVQQVYRILDKAGVGKFYKETDTFVWNIKSMQFAKLILGEDGGAILEANQTMLARRGQVERKPRRQKAASGDPTILLARLQDLTNQQQELVGRLAAILGAGK